MTANPRRFVPWGAWVILAVSLGITAWAFDSSRQHLTDQAQGRFEVRVRQVKSAIEDRLLFYEQVLRGGQGLFAASDRVTREEWRRFVGSLHVQKNYPGIQGIGYIERVRADDLQEYLVRIRSDVAPDFRIDPPGPRREYDVVTFMEPHLGNEERLGFDHGIDTENFRPAADLARDQAGPVSAVRRKSRISDPAQYEIAVYLPVFRNGMPTVTIEDRRAAIQGWVYSPLRIGEMMRGLVGEAGTDIDFEVYDDLEMTPAHLLYVADPNYRSSSEEKPTFVYAAPIEVGGRLWMLNFFTEPEFDRAIDSGRPVLVLIAGLLASLLIFGVIRYLQVTRSLAEAQAESMTVKLRSVLETASEAFIAMDEQGVITDWNRQAEQTFGWPREEALGRRMPDLILPPKQRETHIQGIRRFLETSDGGYLNRRMEQTALRRDGTEFPVELTLWPIRIAGVYTFNLFVHDIADRLKAQRDLMTARDLAEGANRAKSEFLANMSHELRSPLNSVIGFANILLQNKNQSIRPEDLAYVDRIIENGRYLMRLINEVLDLSKVEAGQMDLEIEPLYLDALIIETLRQMEGRVLGRSLKLVADLPRVLAPIETDATRMKQILINLIGNAIQYTDHGTVTVRVAADPDTHRPVRIDVNDTGAGIPRERMDVIFEPFQQGDRRLARQVGGTGLGLSITRSLCQMLGYEIEVSSELGRGTTFRILLPAELPGALAARRDIPAESQPVAAKASEPAEDGNGIAGKTVLVIDDDPDSRLVLMHYCEGLGLKVITAGSGSQGIRVARERRPDLITVDLLMPDQNGWEVVESIRSVPDLAGVPLVVISTLADENRKTFRGLADVINKPVMREDLIRVLKKNLSVSPSHPAGSETFPK